MKSNFRRGGDLDSAGTSLLAGEIEIGDDGALLGEDTGELVTVEFDDSEFRTGSTGRRLGEAVLAVVDEEVAWEGEDDDGVFTSLFFSEDAPVLPTTVGLGTRETATDGGGVAHSNGATTGRSGQKLMGFG